MKKTDLAYIAGIIDGEGSICLSHSYTRNNISYYQVRVSVVMVEEYIPRWLQLSFGGGVYKRIPEPPRRISYQWTCIGTKAKEFLHTIYPYLIIKKPQAEVAFRFWAIKPKHKRRSPEQRILQEKEIITLRNLNFVNKNKGNHNGHKVTSNA